MTKKTLKGSLISSILVLALCFTALVGTTFAWFTDSATSTGNIIKTGSLDVEMSWADGAKDVPAVDSADWVDASTGAIFNYEKWEPGYAVARHIQIKNAGTLALKYQIKIVANAEVSKLADVIDVYYVDPAVKVTGHDALTADKKIGTLTDVLAGMDAAGNLPVGEMHNITLVLKMQETAGNEYKNMSLCEGGFSVQILATQLNYEEDSFGPDYDEGADAVVVNTADEFVAALANGGEVALGADISVSDIVTISKDTVIYGNGNTITSTMAGASGRAINISGAENVTINDLKVVAAGERAINIIQGTQNVTLNNVNATAANYAVNVAGTAAGAKVTVNNSTITGLNAVNIGAANTTVNLSNCTINCNDNSSVESYGAISLNSNATGSNVTVNACTFDVKGDSKAINNSAGATVTVTDSNADVTNMVAYISYGDYAYAFTTITEAFAYAKNGETIVLLADVNLATIEVNANVTVDTNGFNYNVATVTGTGSVTVA